MRVRVEHDWTRDHVNVVVYDEYRRAYLASDGVTWKPITEAGVAEDIDWTVSLPARVLEAIVAEASGVLPASAEQGAALADSRVVRDRLLTLVEQTGRGCSMTPNPLQNRCVSYPCPVNSLGHKSGAATSRNVRPHGTREVGLKLRSGKYRTPTRRALARVSECVG